MGLGEVIISLAVKSEPSKQRKSSSERMGYSREVADSQAEVRNLVVFQIWTFSGICAMLMPSANGE
jgi:hypothetical protein